MTHKFESNANGLRVLTDHMTGIETVSISVLIKTGSRYEEEKYNGISHFLEHMAFKGTNTRTARQIAEEFDMIGGKFNAYTSREKTVYHAKVLKEDWQKALDIIADIIQNSTFDQKELDSERNVILQEIAQTNDAPDDIVFDYFQEVAFPKQPIGRSILGKEGFIKSVTRDDFFRYVGERYGYRNTIISAAGSLDHDKFTEHAFSKFNNLSTQSIDVYEPAFYVGGDTRVKRDLEQVHLVIGFSGLSYVHPNYYDIQVLSMVVGGGMSSRLFQEIREKRGLAYHISAFNSSYSDCGIFGVYSATSEDKVNELLDATASELHDMVTSISEDEVQRAKAQLKASVLMAKESSMARAEKMASNYAVFGRFVPIYEIISKIDAVSTESLRSVMNKILIQDRKLTFSSIGNIDRVCAREEVATMFGFQA